MQTFDTLASESDYLAWIAGHVDGFVINSPRAVAPSAVRVLHSATCWTIGYGAAGGGRLTARTYIKVCSTGRGELEDWSAGLSAGALRPCGTCLRGSPARPAPSSPLRAQRPLAARPPMTTASALAGPGPRRWRPGEVLVSIEGVRPLVASWNKSTDPARVRLKAYLDDLELRAGAARFPATGLFLDLVVDVEVEGRLLRQYDLENYLTPIASRFGASRFVHARALKRIGGGSSLRIGLAEPTESLDHRWTSLAFEVGGSAPDIAKKQLRAALTLAAPDPLQPGPVAVDLAWRLAAGRNWVAWWKPTGDAMGPVLGEPESAHPFNPNDDRIVELSLHRDTEQAIAGGTQVALAWRSLR